LANGHLAFPSFPASGWERRRGGSASCGQTGSIISLTAYEKRYSKLLGISLEKNPGIQNPGIQNWYYFSASLSNFSLTAKSIKERSKAKNPAPERAKAAKAPTL
jgi:hypothetical protein